MEIVSNTQYQAALAAIETFIGKGFSKLNGEETEQLRQTSLAVEAYGKKNTLCLAKKLHEKLHINGDFLLETA